MFKSVKNPIKGPGGPARIIICTTLYINEMFKKLAFKSSVSFSKSNLRSIPFYFDFLT
jgi:hypothetical protein